MPSAQGRYLASQTQATWTGASPGEEQVAHEEIERLLGSTDFDD